jgi:MFS family permease
MKKTSPHLIAFLVVAIDLLGFGIVLPLLPRYAERFEHDIPREWIGPMIGALMSAFSFMQFLLSPFWGRLSDRIGRRPVLLVGLAGSVVFYALFGYATIQESLLLLFVARIGQGIAGATIATAQAVIADCTPPEQRARGMALIGMAFGIGFTFGPLIGTFTTSSDLNGPPSVLPGFVAAGICLVGLILAIVLLPETLRPGPREPRHWLDTRQLRWALSHPPVAVPLAAFFLSIIAFGQFEGTMARFTKDVMEYTDQDNSWIFLYIGVVLTVAQAAIVRRLVPRVGEVAMIVAGTGLMFVGLTGMWWAVLSASKPIMLTILALAVIGFACLTPSVQALVSRRSSAEHQGEVLGINQSVGAIARIIGPLMGNVLYGAKGDPHYKPYIVSGCLMILAMVLAVTLRGERKSSEATEPTEGAEKR